MQDLDNFNYMMVAQMAEQEALQYEQLIKNCKKIRTGDIVFVDNRNLIGNLIKFGTKGVVNHTGIVVKIDGMQKDEHVMVAEATSAGFVIKPYSYYYIQSSCAIGRVFEELSKEDRDFLRSEIVKLLGTPYGWNDILTIIKYILIRGRGMPVNNLTEDANKIICSEAVPLVYKRALSYKLSNKPFRLTTPQDLYERNDIVRYKELDGTWNFKEITGDKSAI